VKPMTLTRVRRTAGEARREDASRSIAASTSHVLLSDPRHR
jgi:hypothetical protein